MKVWHHGSSRPASRSQLDESMTRQRRGRGRLDDTGHPAAIAGSDLVHDQVQRVIEGRDRRHHADRFLRGERPATVARRRKAHRDLAAGEVPQLVGGVHDTVDRAFHLDHGVAQRLAPRARSAMPGGRPAFRQRRRAAQGWRCVMLGFSPAIAIPETPMGKASSLCSREAPSSVRHLGDRSARS